MIYCTLAYNNYQTVVYILLCHAFCSDIMNFFPSTAVTVDKINNVYGRKL